MDLDISEGLLKRLSEIAGKIEDSANEMKGMELEKAREKFKDLSQAMIMLLKEFQGKIEGAEKAYVYYCPMVDASWLQKEKGTLNPYYGSAMLKCGSVKEEIP
jgi:predicted nuclease with TOPRIM domain